ncbi:MAG: hypothetical protein IJA82_07965 [Clostridia bacterium]|nr:hypothetical protein [Clostridia bacterium]
MTNKEKYEQLILASPLFSLERETSAYKKEALKMVEYLYLYMLSINESKYIEYGLEITETANKCILSFKKENGSFLNYFNTSMAKEYRRSSAKKQIEEMRGGIHIAGDDERNIRKIVKYINSHGIDEPTKEHIRLMAEAYELDEEYVEKLIRANREAVTISPRAYNENGEGISIFDMIPSSESADGELYDKENCEEILSKIEECFLECQERQKLIISESITRLICEIIVQYEINISKYSFINEQMIVEYIKTGKTPTQREIATKFGKNEASVSRTINEFLKRIKGSLN